MSEADPAHLSFTDDDQGDIVRLQLSQMDTFVSGHQLLHQCQIPNIDYGMSSYITYKVVYAPEALAFCVLVTDLIFCGYAYESWYSNFASRDERNQKSKSRLFNSISFTIVELHGHRWDRFCQLVKDCTKDDYKDDDVDAVWSRQKLDDMFKTIQLTMTRKARDEWRSRNNPLDEFLKVRGVRNLVGDFLI